MNMNRYANKKSAAQSMLNVSLLTANISELKTVLGKGPGYTFYAPLITLISISLALQIIVGILLIFIGKCHALCYYNFRFADMSVSVCVYVVYYRFCSV